MNIQLAVSDEQILLCFPVMIELRPHLKKENFVSLIKRMQKDGYTVSYIEVDKKAVAVSGFRITEMLHRGRSIYVDDLVTLPDYRSKGYGGKLLDWITQFAKEHECEQIHL